MNWCSEETRVTEPSKGSVRAQHAVLQWNLNEKVAQSQSVKSDHSEAPIMRKAVRWTGIQSGLGSEGFLRELSALKA